MCHMVRSIPCPSHDRPVGGVVVLCCFGLVIVAHATVLAVAAVLRVAAVLAVRARTAAAAVADAAFGAIATGVLAIVVASVPDLFKYVQICSNGTFDNTVRARGDNSV